MFLLDSRHRGSCATASWSSSIVVSARMLLLSPIVFYFIYRPAFSASGCPTAKPVLVRCNCPMQAGCRCRQCRRRRRRGHEDRVGAGSYRGGIINTRKHCLTIDDGTNDLRDLLVTADDDDRTARKGRNWAAYLVNLADTNSRGAGVAAALGQERRDEAGAGIARSRERRAGYSSRSGEVGAAGGMVRIGAVEEKGVGLVECWIANWQ